MAKYKSITIKAARDIAKQFDKDQVIILTWDKAYNTTHVTTYGKSIVDCEQAATGGNLIKRQILKWPEEKCKDMPARIRRKKITQPECEKCGRVYCDHENKY